MAGGVDVVAAGAVITRRGGREVLLVHRPKYDDWSFPKGKQDPGEHLLTTALREVYEETRLQIHLGRRLPSQFYEVAGGRSKVVHYWVARLNKAAGPSTFIPNAEVDEIRWMPIEKAVSRLSYLDDREILEAFCSFPKRTHALTVLRHASAKKRASWEGKDAQRPLSGKGRAEAEALVPLFAAFGIDTFHSSTSTRCLETVEPAAAGRGVVVHPELSEEGVDGVGVRALLQLARTAETSVAVCSHRPVLPLIFASLGVADEQLAPAEFVVYHHRGGRIVGVERHAATGC